MFRGNRLLHLTSHTWKMSLGEDNAWICSITLLDFPGKENGEGFFFVFSFFFQQTLTEITEILLLYLFLSGSFSLTISVWTAAPSSVLLHLSTSVNDAAVLTQPSRCLTTTFKHHILTPACITTHSASGGRTTSFLPQRDHYKSVWREIRDIRRQSACFRTLDILAFLFC